MLAINNIYKSYATMNGKLQVLQGLSLQVKPGEKVAILGRNGAGKSTLIRMIGGLESPDSGSIKSSMSISWPLGYTGGMQGSLTGIDNIMFLCRIYGQDPRYTIEFVNDFAELDSFIREPIKTYSAGMRGRLNFALSMAFNFDCLLIDEGLSAGDERFQARCKKALDDKKNCSIVMVSHSKESLTEFCNVPYILENGTLKAYDNMQHAFENYI